MKIKQVIATMCTLAFFAGFFSCSLISLHVKKVGYIQGFEAGRQQISDSLYQKGFEDGKKYMLDSVVIDTDEVYLDYKSKLTFPDNVAYQALLEERFRNGKSNR